MNYEEHLGEKAGRPDKIPQDFFSETVRAKALSKADIQPGGIAADIGVGMELIIKDLHDRGLEVIVVDNSVSTLERMKKKFAKLDGIYYRIGEAKSLPIPSQTIDYAFSNMFLHHVDYPLEAIKEMVRILKPGGTLVIVDLDEHQLEALKLEHKDRWMGFRRDPVAQWLTEAGLKNVSVEGLEENCGTPTGISIFIASGRK